ncbi:MAG: class I SAM-dependent RNA methyltransferase [Desulfobacterales bacterium]|nr:class I SAM-dependent RNA methyltransferase [Desulfobacterales bacterium]
MVIKRKKGTWNKLKYDFQIDSGYYAQVAESIKEFGVKELSELGAEEIVPDFRGIYFKADPAALYRINYLTRVISRILAPIKSFDCPTTDIIYEEAKKIRWFDFFTEENTFAVFANVSDSTVFHSKFAALRLKDAVADYFRDKSGRRPNVDTMNPDVNINLHIRKDKAVISIDVSGGPLHKRGYREEAVIGPMQETVAAAIIRIAEWDGSVPLYDPMCGSGTLLCEALMHYCKIPSGIFREKFGFESLPYFDRSLWNAVKKEADGNIREIPEGLIAGSDLESSAVRASGINLMGLHHGKNVSVTRSDFRDLPEFKGYTIIANPPYGIRMGKDQNLYRLYKDLGDFLKQKCKGSAAYIYAGDPKYIKQIGLKATWKKEIRAGGLEGKLVKYEMY